MHFQSCYAVYCVLQLLTLHLWIYFNLFVAITFVQQSCLPWFMYCDQSHCLHIEAPQYIACHLTPVSEVPSFLVHIYPNDTSSSLNTVFNCWFKCLELITNVVGKKIHMAQSCNFLSDTANFWRNSNKWLRISKVGDYRCSKFRCCLKNF